MECDVIHGKLSPPILARPIKLGLAGVEYLAQLQYLFFFSFWQDASLSLSLIHGLTHHIFLG